MIPDEHICSASQHISAHIADSHELLQNVKTIALYAAYGPEVSLSTLHELLPGIRFVYPRCHPHHQLTFHHISNPAELVSGIMNIPEPVLLKHQEVPIAQIDLILCPGLAFGMDGSRLGQGGGYYDRALAHFNAKTCGIAMNHQIKPSVPSDHHDSNMDYLASETGVQATKQ